MLIISTWWWGEKYGVEYVERLRSGVARNLKADHEFRVFSPDEGWEHLKRGCFVRLRMFDPYWQHANDIKPGDRIVCMDLDSIVTGNLDPLFAGPEPFKILQGANSSNPCPYNGSLWYLDAGYRADVWSEFSLAGAADLPFFAFPDDQGWLAAKLPNAAGWKAGPESGVYAFQKPGWPKGEALPRDARVVAFPGWRDPSQYVRLDWVAANWR